jgi:CreA protein
MVVRRLALAAALVLATPAAAEQVDEIGTDWTGNDIVIEAIADPKVSPATYLFQSGHDRPAAAGQLV